MSSTPMLSILGRPSPFNNLLAILRPAAAYVSAIHVKEGLGAWRHMLFATDSYTPQSGPLPEIVARGSLPGHAVAKGGTPREMADDIERRYPDMIAASRGSLPAHVRWYRELLEAYPGKAFELENMPHVNVL